MWIWFDVVAFLVRFFSSLVVLLVRFEIDHGVQLFRSIPQEILEITDEAVDVSLAGGFVDDVLIVVVAQAATELLVVHLGLVLADAPASGHLVGIAQLELPAVARPRDEILARFVR